MQVCDRSAEGGSTGGVGTGAGGGAGAGGLGVGLGGVCSLGSSSLSSITARFFFFLRAESEESSLDRGFFSGSWKTKNKRAQAIAAKANNPTINGHRRADVARDPGCPRLG